MISPSTPAASSQYPVDFRRGLRGPRRLSLWLLLAALILSAPGAAWAQSKYAGTYRIEGWEELETRNVYHFFYLHPDGVFLLAGEWPGNETSRFQGQWRLEEDRLILKGNGRVKTNQGNWTAEYSRTFRIVIQPDGFQLVPVPEKNRFGLMGWPNPFRYYRPRPAVNLPKAEFPSEEGELLDWIKKRLK